MHLLILVFISFVTHATTLEVVNDVAGTTIRSQFSFSGKPEFVKPSNFVGNLQDKRIGKFTTSQDLKKITADLKNISERTKASAKLFPQKEDDGHGTTLVIDQITLRKGSRDYKETLQLVNKLLALDWKLLDGIEVEKPFMKTTFRKGKEVSSEAFEPGVHCQRTEKFSICHFSGVGQVVIE